MPNASITILKLKLLAQPNTFVCQAFSWTSHLFGLLIWNQEGEHLEVWHEMLEGGIPREESCESDSEYNLTHCKNKIKAYVCPAAAEEKIIWLFSLALDECSTQSSCSFLFVMLAQTLRCARSWQSSWVLFFLIFFFLWRPQTGLFDYFFILYFKLNITYKHCTKSLHIMNRSLFYCHKTQFYTTSALKRPLPIKTL